MTVPAVLYHDSLGMLAPLTDLRASFDVRIGAMTLRERVAPVAVYVPPELDGLYREHPYHHGEARLLVNAVPAGLKSVVLINGRAPLAPAKEIAAFPVGQGFAVGDGSARALIGAHVEPGQIARILAGDLGGLTLAPPSGTAGAPNLAGEAPWLIDRPWHVRTLRDACLASDLARIKQSHSVRLPFHATVITGHHEVVNLGTIEPGVVLDCSHGDIVVMNNAVVRPGAILIGPCYVGPGSTVLERATIRPGTAIGPVCKVNGEVGGTIFQGYANKAHDGYLGDSWVGEWVNLGAGTTNSNLLNTYGEIIAKATPSGKNERTGETFLGAIIGDHVKTAICTRIMTGSVLHSGSMFATTAPVSGCVGAFTWATDDPTTGRPMHKPYRLDKFLEVMKAAMSRRKVEASAGYLKRVAALHG